MANRRTFLLLCLVLAAPAAAAQESVDVGIGEAVERHLPSDEPFTPWALDPELLDTELGDRLEQREVVADDVEIVKLTGVVPPIRYESGVAEIPPKTVERLRGVLRSMKHLKNVRLHLVGHADDQPLSSALAGVFGDNAGLSRERVGEAAEFLQAALGLPPESISFEWAGDSQPIASNATAEGRALNRRVEIEVWYDEVGKKVGLAEVVVPEEIKRIKVCRMETVCKLRYREGHDHRARVRNLIAPLHFDDSTVGVQEEFIRQVGEALHNLRDKRNVTVKFIGYTDDVPLTGRAERIYGTHVSLSKARAHRVALAVRDALDLLAAAIDSDGRGAAQPVASNETPQGRALNRRIEVEFWHDDPLQELPDEPQPCPDESDGEVVTRVYDPPWGRIAPVPIEGGQPVIPTGYADLLRRALDDVAGRSHVRLRFVGYTKNERLDRRTAIVYGDDIGLSAARARRTMETIAAELELSEAQAEHEGRGFVHSNDVVNAGFVQGGSPHVVVQVVYDELLPLDDYEGVDVTPITRELHPVDPLALNLMRISVDGEPIDDPGRSSADVQRCTDVALERADIQFRFDSLTSEPRLSVTSDPASLPVWPSGADGGVVGSPVRFWMYTNYLHFIERSEVRIFDRGQSLQAEPRAVVEVGPDGLAEWQPTGKRFAAPKHELVFVLRAYGEDGRFDETAPQSLWMIYGNPPEPVRAEAEAGAASSESEAGPQRDPLLAGYGESGLALRNIALGNSGTVGVRGSGIPPQHTVWLAGSPVPVDERGRFAAEAILPSGTSTVEVAVLDPSGNGELFLRDVDLEDSDWFYLAMADLTLSWNQSSGDADLLQGKDSPYDLDSFADGRLAFFVTGKFWEDWKLTASADTREGPLEDLFTNFLDKSPESLFRRIDPEYHYPTFGDDGTVDEHAPTSGKLYIKLSQRENHALWGNFEVDYLDNELAQVDRGLYGANVHYQSEGVTSFGEQRLAIDGFAAQPGTVPSREEFRGTGGSLYFLRRQDLLVGSERLRVEIRDKVTGLVTAVLHLRPELDYDIDYLQGRIALTEPIGSTVGDELLVRSGGLSGDEAWMVVQYEYAPGFDEIDAMAAGGQGHYWFNENIRLGLTANHNDADGSDSTLYGADLTFRMSKGSWLKLQAGRSEGLVSTTYRSDDGGFRFFGSDPGGLTEANAGAYRADLSVAFGDIVDGASGRLNLYGQRQDAGYSAPGQAAFTDTNQFGGAVELPVTGWLQLTAKADSRLEKDGLETTAGELDVGYQLTDHWRLGSGVRYEIRQDESPIVPVTQVEGNRTDAAVQVAYDSNAGWRSYGFAQATLAKTGDRENNHRGGVGGSFRISERLSLDGEVSYGNLGPAARIGTSYQQSEATQTYLSYSLENERMYDGLHQRRGNLIAGARARLSDSSSAFLENRYQHTSSTTGLSRALGINLAPTDRWNLGASWENGSLFDRQTHAETRRRAGGASVGYAFGKMNFSSGFEYRYDEMQQLDGTWTDRTTWLIRSSLKCQLTPDWRLLGKFNHSDSESSLGQFYDGGYTEAAVGFAFRPVNFDRLNVLGKYTYFYNFPTAEQVTLQNTLAEFIQRSHILSLDVTYDLTSSWTLGGKYAYRLGEVSLDREHPDFFSNNAHLYVLRSDLRFWKNWETSLEGRMLHLPDLSERRIGALITLYRYLGDHFKVGVGYNFTDFSDDLTDLSFDHRGVFFNVVGTL
jgi:flagellar motor protein MotB